MKKAIFIFLGLVLLFSFGCPSEEVPAAVETPEEPQEEVQLENETVVEPEVKPEPEEDAPIEEEQNETVEEEPEEEPIVCVPITLTGTAEIALCTEDSLYCNEKGDKHAVYGKEVKIGDTMSLPSGAKVILEDIVLDAECDECGEKPTWTYSQLAKLRITVPNAPEDLVIYADVGDTGTFISGYKCKTLDWDGKTCLEWIPEKENQYFVGKIVADKICVTQN